MIHLGGSLVLPTNIRLGWKGLPGTNTIIAYFKKSVNYGRKKFDKTGPKTISFKNYMEDTLEGLWMKGASSLGITTLSLRSFYVTFSINDT